jgi:hypothetical protein
MDYLKNHKVDFYYIKIQKKVIYYLSRLPYFGCNAGATPVIPGAHNALCGQNLPVFVHCVDTMHTMNAVLFHI